MKYKHGGWLKNLACAGIAGALILLLSACSQVRSEVDQNSNLESEGAQTETIPDLEGIEAEVVSVQISGDPLNYQFRVELSSPDLGCEQYADWWEIISEEGDLVYRRILAHSHVEEQPFQRSGGPVEIQAETLVLIRAHMSTGGYGRLIMKGSAVAGFRAIEMEPAFAAELEAEPPQPTGCAF
jgi:hypothetical protein